ncbi:MAG TPA: hypothetical protein VFZ24_14470 [Longimicrobiales bacterium]
MRGRFRPTAAGDIMPWTTVHELAEQHRLSNAVLRAHGLCSHARALTLAALAERDGVHLAELLRGLRAAARRAGVRTSGTADAIAASG